MTNVIPNNSDNYVSEVMGEPRKNLICTDKKKSDGTIDVDANMSATLANLNEEADRLSRLTAKQSSCETLTKKCIKSISDARSILSKPNFNADDVLNDFDAVKRYLIQANESRRLWPKLFCYIFIYNLFITAVFVGIMVWKSLIPDKAGASSGMAVGILACAIWGGVGGVVDALAALISHFTDRNFDEQYQPWYFLHPLLGMSLGAIIYLVFQAGLASISNSSTATGSGTVTIQVGVTALSIAVAFLAGFKQTAAISFLSRIVNSVFKTEDSTDKKS